MNKYLVDLVLSGSRLISGKIASKIMRIAMQENSRFNWSIRAQREEILHSFHSAQTVTQQPKNSSLSRHGINWKKSEKKNKEMIARGIKHKLQKNYFFMLIQFKLRGSWWCTRLSGMKALLLSLRVSWSESKLWQCFTYRLNSIAQIYLQLYSLAHVAYFFFFENVKTVELVECKERIFRDTKCFIYLFWVALVEWNTFKSTRRRKRNLDSFLLSFVFFSFPKSHFFGRKSWWWELKKSFEIFLFLFLVPLCIWLLIPVECKRSLRSLSEEFAFELDVILAVAGCARSDSALGTEKKQHAIDLKNLMTFLWKISVKKFSENKNWR